MRTLEEKYKYNKKKNSVFSRAYCRGVDLYRNYNNLSARDKEVVKEYISQARFFRNEDSKGLLCGYRDASIERKYNHSSNKEFRR